MNAQVVSLKYDMVAVEVVKFMNYAAVVMAWTIAFLAIGGML